MKQKIYFLDISKNCETLIDLTHTRYQETVEFKLTQPKHAFFTPPINLGLESNWTLGLTSLELYFFNDNRRKY